MHVALEPKWWNTFIFIDSWKRNTIWTLLEKIAAWALTTYFELFFLFLEFWINKSKFKVKKPRSLKAQKCEISIKVEIGRFFFQKLIIASAKRGSEWSSAESYLDRKTLIPVLKVTLRGNHWAKGVQNSQLKLGISWKKIKNTTCWRSRKAHQLPW